MFLRFFCAEKPQTGERIKPFLPEKDVTFKLISGTQTSTEPLVFYVGQAKRSTTMIRPSLVLNCRRIFGPFNNLKKLRELLDHHLFQRLQSHSKSSLGLTRACCVPPPKKKVFFFGGTQHPLAASKAWLVQTPQTRMLGQASFHPSIVDAEKVSTRGTHPRKIFSVSFELVGNGT